MRKREVLICVSICALLGLVACTKQTPEYKPLLEKAMQEKSGAELLNALLELDQRYSETFEVKERVGELMLAAGDVTAAEVYLKKAESLIGSAASDRERSRVHLALGVLEFERKRYAESLARAEQALVLLTEDSEGAAFLKARGLAMTGKKDEARELYKKNWHRRDRMSRLDMNIYFDQAVSEKDYSRALEILDAYQLQFEYRVGQGAQAAYLFEELGMLEEAVIASAMELEYLLYAGRVNKDEIAERLRELEQKLGDKEFNPEQAGRSLVEGLRSYFQENWESARRSFESLKTTHRFSAYLKSAALLEGEGATVERLKEYVGLESYMKSFPSYYYHFWRGMKKGGGAYGYDTAREVLEKAIALFPATSSARETRREIGRLIGLESADGEKIMLPTELDQLRLRIGQGEEPSLLQPVLDLLSIPDNIYTMNGVMFLRSLSLDLPSVRAFLRKRKDAASGRVKERLVMILEG